MVEKLERSTRTKNSEIKVKKRCKKINIQKEKGWKDLALWQKHCNKQQNKMAEETIFKRMP